MLEKETKKDKLPEGIFSSSARTLLIRSRTVNWILYERRWSRRHVHALHIGTRPPKEHDRVHTVHVEHTLDILAVPRQYFVGPGWRFYKRKVLDLRFKKKEKLMNKMLNKKK